MIDVALGLAPLWENALGADWRNIMTRDRVRDLYRKDVKGETGDE